MQISAFYFLTLEKADCTIFTRLLNWLVGWSLVSITINFLSPNNVLLLFLICSSSLHIKYFSSPNIFLLRFPSPPKRTFSYSKYFSPFPSPFFFTKIFPSPNIFLIFLLGCLDLHKTETIFLLQLFTFLSSFAFFIWDQLQVILEVPPTNGEKMSNWTKISIT